MNLFDSDRWQEIYHTLAKNKLRTFLTAFGVFWGIFMLIIMLGSGNGLQTGVLHTFSGMASNSMFMWAQRTTVPYMGFPRGRSFNMQNEDMQSLLDNIPEIDILAPRNQLGGHRGANGVTRGQHSAAFSVMGDYPQILKIQNLPITNGRFLNDFDIEEKRKVAVIGTRVEEILFEPGEDPLGEYIQINGVYFKVIGVFQPEGTGDQADRSSQTIYLPFTTFQHAFNYGNNVGWIAFTAKDNIPVSLVGDKVIAQLKQRHRISPDDERAFGHWNSEEEFKKMNGLFAGIKLLIWIVGTGTLLAGIIGVSNIMLIVVRERTKEIGIRRALGATPTVITSQIILESVVLTFFAGYLGLVAGVALLEFISVSLASSDGAGMFKDPGVNLGVALQSLFILVTAGMLAGLIPAKRALSISTVDALRNE